MTLGELMQFVLRLQAQVRELGEALAAYDGWRDDVPGDNVNFCADTADSIAYDLTSIRDSLRDELNAATRASVNASEGIEPDTGA